MHWFLTNLHFFLLLRLTCSHDVEKTVGRLAGLMTDTDDPDKYSTSNVGAIGRIMLFCTPRPSNAAQDWEAPIKEVNLTGPFLSIIQNLNFPCPSELDLYITLRRCTDSMLITKLDPLDKGKYRLVIRKIELKLPKETIEVLQQEKLEHIWKNPNPNPIMYVFNRLEVTTCTVGSNELTFETPILFRSMEIPPLFMVLHIYY